MRFKNTRLITAGVDSRVSPLLQLFLWHCIDAMPPPKDYLQIFSCTIFDGKQKITHIQEIPEYRREYLLDVDTSFSSKYRIPFLHNQSLSQMSNSSL